MPSPPKSLTVLFVLTLGFVAAASFAGPLPDPDALATDSPQRALALYLAAWRAEDWPTLAGLCQLSWRARQEAPEVFLREQLAGRRLLTAEITGATQGCGSLFPSFHCATVRVALSYQTPDGRVHAGLIHARLFREEAPGQLGERGSWGVNPLSALP